MTEAPKALLAILPAMSHTQIMNQAPAVTQFLHNQPPPAAFLEGMGKLPPPKVNQQAPYEMRMVCVEACRLLLLGWPLIPQPMKEISMPYVQGFVLAVPTTSKQAFIEWPTSRRTTPPWRR